MIILPRRSRGRLSAAARAQYQIALRRFCDEILEINSTLDFKVSSRGWAYILEQHHGLPKGDFDVAERLINDCRKDGRLPVDTCCEDDGRQAEYLEQIDNETPQEFAPGWIDYVGSSVHKPYKPDRPPSLRVDFYTSELSEWLPFEHDDGARWYAAEKWPALAGQDEIKSVAAISVQRDGEYWRVVDVMLQTRL